MVRVADMSGENVQATTDSHLMLKWSNQEILGVKTTGYLFAMLGRAILILRRNLTVLNCFKQISPMQ